MVMVDPNELFSLLSDGTRLRCLMLLHKKGELCVCELCEVLDAIQPKISRHIALMRKSGLVSHERKGQWVHYSLHPDLPDWVKAIIQAVYVNLSPQEPYCTDIRKIEDLEDGICKKG